MPMVVPFLMLGGTDSGHYANISRGGVLRFDPYSVSQAAGVCCMLHGRCTPVHPAPCCHTDSIATVHTVSDKCMIVCTTHTMHCRCYEALL